MVDRSKKLHRSDSENTTAMMMMSDDSSEGIDVKTCVDCGTSRTPLWRSGPAGPKSLCNACGIKSRKKRRSSSSSSSSSVHGLNKGLAEERKSKRSTVENTKKIVAAAVTRKRSTVEKLRRKITGEEEQAAFLLMALSCGTVYAY